LESPDRRIRIFGMGSVTLRVKLILLFVFLGLAPVLLVGSLEQAQATRSLEDLVRAQTAELARRSSDAITSRHAAVLSDLRLFGENVESLKWLRHRVSASSGEDAGETGEVAVAFLRMAWERLSGSFAWIELIDGEGATLLRLGDPRGIPGPVPRPQALIQYPVLDVDGSSLGSVRASVEAEVLLNAEALSNAFGSEGYQMVLDGERQAVLFHSQRGRTSDGALDWPIPAASDSGWVQVVEGGRRMIGSYRRAGTLPWTVLSVGSIDEFAGPFEAGRRRNTLLLLLIAVVMSGGFAIALERATRSLKAVTRVAGGVAEGHWPDASDLPEPSHDEVGTLSRAFRTMLEEIQAMIARIERSRQLAVLGEFASSLAHEIRNPLTSIKLNLQRLERRARESGELGSVEAPLRIALREVENLEALAGSVLGLARPRRGAEEPLEVGGLLREVAAAVGSEAESRGVAVEVDARPDLPDVFLEPTGLRGALLNLVLNAVHATPLAGQVRMTAEVEGGEDPVVLRIEVSDSGPGVPDAIRDRIFDPFFTTRTGGTGFGLAIAARAVEEQDGELTLAEVGKLGGATFVIRIPLTGGEEAAS
jgi:signal transduction histidine kinase